MNKINGQNITAGLIAVMFGCTGSALLVINAAENLNLSQHDIISWLFSIYFCSSIYFR